MRAAARAGRGVLVVVVMSSSVWLSAQSRAQAALAQAQMTSLAGGWTLNRNPVRENRPPEGRGDARGRQGSGPAGGRRGGTFGGPFGGDIGGPVGRGNREQMARQRDALRDITDPPEHLIVTVTETMVILTGPDGRTTRLSPDGSKIKDENTKIERKTRWTAGRLVSEIDGLGPKIAQTFSVDAERRQLRVLVEIEADRGGQGRTMTHIYDADPR